ncbi:MAG: response regulator [Gemmatimonadales bacterium]
MGSTRSKRYWGTQRVARVCQVSPATVASWIDQGHLKGHKTPTGRRRVLEADLIDFLRAHGMSLPPDIGQDRGPETVVVVDDNPTYLKALVRTIEQSELDVEVVEAANGMDALLEIGRTHPAVIVLDYALPDMNGYEVVRRLLEPGRSLEAEVLVVTGGVRPEDEAGLRELGVETIIYKTDGMDAIIEAMGRALRRTKAA